MSGLIDIFEAAKKVEHTADSANLRHFVDVLAAQVNPRRLLVCESELSPTDDDDRIPKASLYLPKDGTTRTDRCSSQQRLASTQLNSTRTSGVIWNSLCLR